MEFLENFLEEELYIGESYNDREVSEAEEGFDNNKPATEEIMVQNDTSERDNENRRAESRERLCLNLIKPVHDDTPPLHAPTMEENIMDDIFGTDDDNISPIRNKSSFLSNVVIGSPEKDIGYTSKDGPNQNEELKSSEQQVLNEVYDAIGWDR